MTTVNNRILITFLIVALVIVYLVKSVPANNTHVSASPAASARKDKKRQKKKKTSPVEKTSTTNTGLSNLLKCVKWETISNMLHWKSEMSNLDNLLDQLDPQHAHTGPIEHSP